MDVLKWMFWKHLSLFWWVYYLLSMHTGIANKQATTVHGYRRNWLEATLALIADAKLPNVVGKEVDSLSFMCWYLLCYIYIYM